LWLRSGFLLNPGLGVFEREGPVEDFPSLVGLGVRQEGTDALKLKAVLALGFAERLGFAFQKPARRQAATG